MPTYLDTVKIQALNRLALGPAALRNMGISIGDSVEIFFDEKSGCVLIKPLGRNENQKDGQSGLPSIQVSKRNRRRNK